MHLLIVGGSGFLGSHVAQRAVAAGDRVTITSRHPARDGEQTGVQRVVWDTKTPLLFEGEVDGVVNLAGANLFGRRWTEAYKRKLHDSRSRTTRRIVEWIAAQSEPPAALVSVSGVGYYGLPEDREVVKEDDPVGDDFLAGLSRDWEREALRAVELGTRVVTLRLAILLGRGGGALGRLEPIFRLGVGGTIGNGHQPFPWVSVEDAARVVLRAAQKEDMHGAYNVVAPSRDTNRDLTKALGRALHRPTVLPVPPFVLSLMYGDGARVLTQGMYVEPERLEEEDFEWRDPDLETTFAHLYGA